MPFLVGDCRSTAAGGAITTISGRPVHGRICHHLGWYQGPECLEGEPLCPQRGSHKFSCDASLRPAGEALTEVIYDSNAMPDCMQGLIVLSPAVDCARDFMLTIMVALQSVLCKICPRARIVPQPLIPKVTLNEQEVRCAALIVLLSIPLKGLLAISSHMSLHLLRFGLQPRAC